MERRAAPARLPARAQDALLSLFVAVMQVQGTLARPSEAAERPLTDLGHLGYALLIGSGLVLVVRRRWPVPVFVTVALGSLVYFTLGFPDGPGWVGLFVALYTLTANGDGRRSLAIAGVGIVVLAVGWLAAGADVEARGAIGWVFFRIAASVLAATLDESVRSRGVVAAEAVERARRAERTREEVAHSRVDAERLRIAREVHDTVAHAIAIINVQSGVTAYLLDKRPEGAREALLTIERTSSQALHEMRIVLGVLRDDNGRSPHPGLAQLDDLAAMAREAGLDVELDVEVVRGAAPERGGHHRLPDRAGVDHERHPPRRPEPGDGLAGLRNRRAGGPGGRRGRPDSLARHRGQRRTGRTPGLRGGHRRGRPGDRRDARTLPPAGRAAERRAAAARRVRGQGAATASSGGCGAAVNGQPGPRPGAAAPAVPNAPVRVLLADDQALVRSGFKGLLDAEDDIAVVGEAANGLEAVERARATRPDVVLMDIRMPELDGIKATGQITRTRGLERVRVLILTTYDTDAYVFEALQAGASGFLLKDAGPAELLHAIRVIAAGEALLAPRITRRLIAQFTMAQTATRAAVERLTVLTQREREVLALVGRGLSNDEIGAELFLSPATARTHVSHAMVKLGARDRAQLVVIAYQTGVVSPGPLS